MTEDKLRTELEPLVERVASALRHEIRPLRIVESRIAARAALEAAGVCQPPRMTSEDDIMIGQFVARWEDAADGVVMDADTAETLARCFKEMQARPTGKQIMDEIDTDETIPTDVAIRVYAAIKRAALAIERPQ